MVFFYRAVACALLLLQAGAAEKNNKNDQTKRHVLKVASSSKSVVDTDETKNRPVRKVIDLLKDMKKKLEKELESDEDNYDKMSCWCDTNLKRLQKNIKDDDTEVDDLTAEIERLTALIAELEVQIERLKKEIEKNEKALDVATELRKQQREDFHAEEKDLMESVGALRAALIVLEKHHTGSFLQTPSDHMHTLAVTVQRVMQKHARMLKGVLSRSDRQIVDSMLQLEGSGRVRGAKPPAFTAQSGQIFGILEQMMETFSNNLKQAQADDAEAEQAYQDLKAAKEKEIAAGKKSLSEKKNQLAEAREALELAKSKVPNVGTSSRLDEKFLKELKERCDIVNKEWEVRKVTRQKEIQAVSEALTMLNSEDAHKLFTKTFNPDFLQRGSNSHLEVVQRGSNSHLEVEQQSLKARKQVSKLLSALAKKFNSPKLAAIAASARLDSFTRVKAAIDMYIAGLTKQKAEEFKTVENCRKLIEDNVEVTEAKKHTKKELEDAVSELEESISTLSASIATAKKEIADLQEQLKKAAEERAESNAAFKATIADQMATQQLLNQALKVLKEFYDVNLTPEVPVLVQQDIPYEDPNADMKRIIPEDFGFKVYEKQTEEFKKGGVIGMIKDILYDAQQMVKDAEREEKNEVETFQDLTTDTTESIGAKNTLIATDSEALEEKKATLLEKKQGLEDTSLELDQLSNELADIHKQCDFVMNNFDIRQQARDEEIEALKQAKAILSGAKY